MHQAGGPAGDAAIGSRRSSFCLYAAGHEPHHHIGLQQRSHLYKKPCSGQGDADLGHTAREAKERLDGRLGILRAAVDSRRKISAGMAAGCNTEINGAAAAGFQSEVFSSRREKRVKDGIGKLRWIWAARWLLWSPKEDGKAAAEGVQDEDGEEEECAVCLDGFRDGEELAGLRCGHRFHRDCALPWLRNSGRCPCCRTAVSS